MLTNLDDYPIHQIADVARHVASSDRNFYDRYYFNGFSLDGECMFVLGFGVYPNLGVSDAFILVLHEGQHRVVRASCELEGVDRLNPSVGPFTIDVLEPLSRLRVRCAPNEWGIEIDAVWTGQCAPVEEPRHYIREHGRVIFDTVRLAQTGRWTGSLTANGTTFDLTNDTWWGTRDRSWGVRPVGENEPQGIRAKNPFSWYWIYTPIQFEDHTLLVMMQEQADGSRVLEEAIRVPRGGVQGDIEWLGTPRHALQYIPGSRRSTGGVITIDCADGSEIVITAEPMVTTHIGIGTGYGYDADWRHGMWQGPDTVVQGFHIDTNTPEGDARLFSITDASAKFTYTDERGTHVGYGLFETMAIGPHHQYGFVDMLDGYQPPAAGE
jgi:hypothetical protein